MYDNVTALYQSAIWVNFLVYLDIFNNCFYQKKEKVDYTKFRPHYWGPIVYSCNVLSLFRLIDWVIEGVSDKPIHRTAGS